MKPRIGHRSFKQETSKLSDPSSTETNKQLLLAYKIIDLYYAVGLLLFTAIRLLLAQPGLETHASIALTSSVMVFVLADLWTLHYRARTFLHDALIPTLTIGFACFGIWFVSPFSVMWVFASIPVLFIRMPLMSAYIVSAAAIVVVLNILFFKHGLDAITLARLALAGGMITITLGIFLKILNKINSELTEMTALLDGALQSVSQGISVIGADNRYKLFNQQTCDLLNLPASLLARKPTLPEVVQYQIDRGDFRDLGEITPDARAYIFSRGVNVDEHTKRNYVRKDALGRFIEVKTYPMPSGDVVRTYADVSQYENTSSKLRELLAEQQEMSQLILQRVHEQMIDSMTELALTRDNETGLHIQRTKLYIKTLAQILSRAERYRDQLSDELIEKIVTAAPLHDLGKVGIPDQILLKPSRHTPEETVIMRTHAMLGETILIAAAGADHMPSSLFNIAARIAGGHHENWDGSGYPRGLVGTDIPLEARLMALADVYDALTTERIYKKAWTHEAASEEIYRLSGQKFDPDLVFAFGQAEARFREIAIELNDATSAPQP
jgi:HD-GYP domain-containing protein (c-di-GMP phosphodiesterase class II)